MKKHRDEILLLIWSVGMLILLTMWVVCLIQDSSRAAHLKETREAVKPVTTIEVTIPAEAEPVTQAPYQNCYDIPLETKYQTLVFELCEEYEIPAKVVFAVMHQESNYDFMANSSDSHCIGIMQIHSINYEELKLVLGINNLKDPEENIKSGVYILQKIYKKYGNWDKTLTCYNLGESGAAGKSKSNYSERVLEYAATII